MRGLGLQGCVDVGSEMLGAEELDSPWTKVALRLCILQPGQPSLYPEESHSNTGNRMCDGSCKILRGDLTVCCSQRVARDLTGCPIILEQVSAVFIRRFLSCRVID